ncbi:hypothetical protein GCM10010145_06670 [Streptomyces ruber]|uniref:Uncharacterized protein n=2 Tax=Streptomyces TaxID=1883 RepID=A0A918EPC9_9ACTN|nr:hypothetical protein GCM10010145_06670 [Streptomyces ruber]
MRRQSRRIFQIFIRAKACSTRARTLRWERSRFSFQAARPGVRSGRVRDGARDDQAGAPVAAVGDHCGAADGVLGAGQFPCLAVVAIARQCAADGDDQAGVGVDDDLVVGEVPVVLRLCGDLVVAGGHQGAVHDQDGALAEPLALLQGERRSTPNGGAS